ncbi:hypothetical protein NDU88_005261 [Pleurodeles waltl]|uniref:Uncharacterized protein n=1 Tax=Pleurodeles waltl TaxID=8319 RepID=A0AAV7WU83_PLEWA|nr:hypothetical protein NDU88_005261 [Pleurodeles waltl]
MKNRVPADIGDQTDPKCPRMEGNRSRGATGVKEPAGMLDLNYIYCTRSAKRTPEECFTRMLTQAIDVLSLTVDLDNILLVNQDSVHLRKELNVAKDSLFIGFLLSDEKSKFKPFQIITFLGFVIDSA